MRPILFFLSAFLILPGLHAQFEEHQFKREVQGINAGGWYRIPIPQDMFARLREDMNDLRLMQLGTDTVDTPFIIHSEGYRKSWSGVATREVASRAGAYVFRFEGNESPNRIRVDVKQRNYDVEFSIEGSDNRLVWNPVASRIRMLGMVEEDLSYAMNEADLPQTSYTFLRLVWDDPEVEVEGVALGIEDLHEGLYDPVGIRDWSLSTDTEKHQSVIRIDLQARVPVSKIVLKVEGADSEFARTIDARYVRQTITENDGTQRYLWRDWDRMVLSSMEKAEFHLHEVRTDHIELTIFDQGNLPVAIRGVQVFAKVYELRAMCAGDAEYEVIYGSQQARPPSTTRTRPPSDITSASLGPEQYIRPEEASDLKEGPDFSPNEAPSGSAGNWITFAAGIVVALAGAMIGRMLIKRNRRRKTTSDKKQEQ